MPVNEASGPPRTADILLIEDTPSLRSIYDAHLRNAGFVTLSAASAAEGLALFRKTDPAVVLLDLMLPDRDGIDLMREMLALQPHTAVVVITADSSTARAVKAMRAGAHDFLVKPVSEAQLMTTLGNARAAAQMSRPQAVPGREAPLAGFIGTSGPMRAVYARIRSAARSMAPVFVTGESGTGKELCAQAIHALSPRAAAPFIPLDCGAIPAERFESELFGHLRGAFPGAVTDRPGAAALADGGTLFLDEICDLAPELQPKLLRFLQSATIQPLGAARPQRVDLRVIAASAHEPLQAVRDGRLREDLYYRLRVVPIEMPPLRQRPDDIGPLATETLRRFALLEGRAFTRLSPAAEAVLRAQPWNGNVRELMNVLRAATVTHDGDELTEEMLPEEMRFPAEHAPPCPGLNLTTLAGRSLAEIERLVIEDCLTRHDGSVPRAARELDVAPSTLYRKLDTWRKD